MLKYLTILVKVLSIVPVAVAGVEAAHEGMKGPDKKTAALNLINIGGMVAAAGLPNQAEAIKHLQAAAASAIDATVQMANAVGEFRKPTVYAARV